MPFFWLRRISVWGKGLEGQSIQGIFWLLTLNGTQLIERVGFVISGVLSWAASIRSDKGFYSQNGRMPTYQLGPKRWLAGVADLVFTNRARAPKGRLLNTSW